MVNLHDAAHRLFEAQKTDALNKITILKKEISKANSKSKGYFNICQLRDADHITKRMASAIITPLQPYHCKDYKDPIWKQAKAPALEIINALEQVINETTMESQYGIN